MVARALANIQSESTPNWHQIDPRLPAVQFRRPLCPITNLQLTTENTRLRQLSRAFGNVGRSADARDYLNPYALSEDSQNDAAAQPAPRDGLW
jgi:hypothetical protein